MTVGPAAVRVNAVLTAFRDDENSDVIDALCYFYVPILDKLERVRFDQIQDSLTS